MDNMIKYPALKNNERMIPFIGLEGIFRTSAIIVCSILGAFCLGILIFRVEWLSNVNGEYFININGFLAYLLNIIFFMLFVYIIRLAFLDMYVIDEIEEG